MHHYYTVVYLQLI